MSMLARALRGTSVATGLLAGVLGVVGFIYAGPLPVTPALLLLLVGVGGTPLGATLYGWRRPRVDLAVIVDSAALLFGGTLMGMASIGMFFAPAALLAMVSAIVAAFGAGVCRPR